MEIVRCDECAYWGPTESPGWGTCRCHAPMVGNWPPIIIHGWCGDAVKKEGLCPPDT